MGLMTLAGPANPELSAVGLTLSGLANPELLVCVSATSHSDGCWFVRLGSVGGSSVVKTFTRRNWRF